MRKYLGTLIKLAITLAGLIFALNQIEPGTLQETLFEADPVWIVITFLLVNAGLIVRAYRWLVLLRGLQYDIQLSRLITLYYVGNFFNTFLPTSFGGDVIRAFEVTRDTPADVAAGTVIVDRLAGLLMLFIMALLALPFRPPNFPPALLWLVVGVSVGGLLAGCILLEGRLIHRLGGWLPGVLSPRGEGPVARTLRAVRALGWRAITKALLVSFVFNLILTSWWWTAARALGIRIPFTFLLPVIPILSISLLIPAIGGFGPREAAATLLFDNTVVVAGTAPLPGGTGFALSALVFLVERFAGLIGGAIYLWLLLRGVHQTREKEVEPPITPSTQDEHQLT